MIELQIEFPDGRMVRRPLGRESLTIGRDSSCDISFDDHIITRRHARIFRDADGQIWIEDLKSKNGTTVNDEPITTSRIVEGDRIAIGSYRLSLHEVAAPPSSGVVMGEIETQFGSTSVWRMDQHLNLPQQRLSKLYELNERLTGRFERDELLTEVLSTCMDWLRFDRGGVAVWEGEPHPPRWIDTRSMRPEPSGEFRISRSIVQRALHFGERILVNDVSQESVDPTMSMLANNIRSAICVPLVYHDKVHGVLYGDRTSSSSGYTKEDVDFFAALGRQAAMALANVRLLEERQARERMEAQLQLARQIQNRLFPSEPLVRPDVTIEALNDPGLQVSGDYFDYIVRPDGRIAVVVADVAGKGVPAALLMANLQAAVHVTLIEDTDLVRTVTMLNRLVCRNVESDRFITGIFGLLDPAARRFTFVNAGHLEPLVVAGNVVPFASTGCLPLGVEVAAEFTLNELAIPAAPSTVFLYTDGVPDAQNEGGEHFGEPRLVEALRAARTESPREQIARVRRLIQQFIRNHPQIDDITMLGIRVN